MKKKIIKIAIGFLLGAAIGYFIRYYRDVSIAPFLCGLIGALSSLIKFKKDEN